MGEHIGPSTASPDVLRVEGGSVVLGVDVRTAYGQTFEELSSAFDAAARRYGFTPDYEPFLPAILVSRDRPFLPSLLAAYERRSGEKGDFLCGPGTSYAKALRDHVAFGPILPGMKDLCHMPDERMSFDEIQTCAEIYADAIGEIVSKRSVPPYDMPGNGAKGARIHRGKPCKASLTRSWRGSAPTRA